ncbi:MAG TPA: glycosyltransferase [Candidatus Krumholzibacteria bacterium]|nr:glycosyltransferase [Candidatus Krumholzibacteria bacterium]
MIRVCFMVDAAFLGGAELYVSRLAGSLDRSQFDASVVMRRSADPGLNEWAASVEAQGIRVVRTPMHLPFRPAHAISILRTLEAPAPHVVHVNMPGPYNGQNALLVPLARLGGARVLVTEHLPMVERSARRAALKRLAYRFLDLAVTVSNANAGYVRERQGVPPSRVRVVYNGVEDARAAPEHVLATRARLGAGPEEVLVWFAANLLPHKGLVELLQALSMAHGTNWRLGVMGDGPERDGAERLARGAGLAGRVVFLGRQAPAVVRATLPAGDLLALPSRMEGMPYIVLEAMAAGLPVVSSAVFGIPEAVVDGETGRLTAPGDVPALARALDALLRDAALRRRMGAAARARYEAMFTLDAQVAAMSAIYRELATGRSGR